MFYKKIYNEVFNKLMAKGYAGCWKCSDPECVFNATKSARLLVLLSPYKKGA